MSAASRWLDRVAPVVLGKARRLCRRSLALLDLAEAWLEELRRPELVYVATDLPCCVRCGQGECAGLCFDCASELERRRESEP